MLRPYGRVLQFDQAVIPGADVRLVGVVFQRLGGALLEQLPLKEPSFFNGNLAGGMGRAVVGEQVAPIPGAIGTDPFSNGEADVIELHATYLPFLSPLEQLYSITHFGKMQPYSLGGKHLRILKCPSF